MSISQLFILSRRGDSIIYRDFRQEMKKSNDIFFHSVNFVKEEEIAPPLFNIDGINFIYIKTEDLYIVISTLDNSSPNYYLEVLDRIIKVIKDHIGILSEETIRKNFVLIYEIIDEMIDFGYPQLSDTEQVKEFVFTEPIVELKNINTLKEMISKSSKSNENAKRSIVDAKNNEIYVDIIEKVTCLFSRTGTIISSGIDGCIQMKSYLKNNPELKIVLTDDVMIGKSSYGRGRMELAGYNFYRGVRTRDLENQNTLYIIPPEGEFTLMNYRINNEFAPPFKIYTIVEEFDYKLELKIKLLANFDSNTKAGNITITFNAPKETQSVYFNIPKQFKDIHKTDYNQSEHLCTWYIPKIAGGNENTLDVKFTLQVNKPNICRREIGPIIMAFEIPNFNVSKLQIKELKVMSNDSKNNAMRWVRVFTRAKSYVTRVA